MAVRTPLKLDGSNNLIEMDATDIANIRAQCLYLYGSSPSVTLSQVTSGGNLGTITDTRRIAGSFSSSTTGFVPETSTAEPGTVSVSYSRINSASAGTSEPSDTSNVAFPLYQSGGNLYAMSATDIYDTFIYTAIDTLTNGGDQPGTYRIHTSTSLAGHSLVSATPVFTDTRADTSVYTAGGIPEALDQPFVVTNFYLFVVNAGSPVSYSLPVFARAADYNIQQYSAGSFDTILQNFMRHAATSVVGTRISYNLNGGGNNRGSGMTDTILNGAGNYQQLFVNADDYRSQEFPDGTAVTAGTTFLRITQV